MDLGAGMKRSIYKTAVLVLLAAALLPHIAQSQSGGNLSPQAQANLVTRLWMDTCAKHFPNPVQVRAVAAQYRFQENPPYAQDVLKGQAGTVWDVSLGPHAQNTLILFSDGRCQVRGRRADSKSVNDVFEKVLQGINTPGVSAQRIAEKEIEQDGVQLKQIVYFVSRTGADQGWAFVSTTSDSEKAGAQAVLTVSRSAKPQ